jgi:hypothetical protein
MYESGRDPMRVLVPAMVLLAFASAFSSCEKKEPEAERVSPADERLAPQPRDKKRNVVVIEGTLTRSANGSGEMIHTDRGARYTLRRMPGCKVTESRAAANRPSPSVIHSDCLEFALARLLVAQAVREKPNASKATLREWLRVPGSQMEAEFRSWADSDVEKMIEICRRVGRAKFISGDFPPPARRRATNRSGAQRRYRFRGVIRGRLFEAHSIERQ